MFTQLLRQAFALAIITCPTITNIIAEEPHKTSSILHATTNALLSAGDASQSTTQYLHNLVKELDEHQQLPQVKKMNKLMEYLLGYKNTIALPMLEQVYVNEDWINQLPEEEKRFVIGRTITWLKNGTTYLAIQGALALATIALELKTLQMQERAAQDPINLQPRLTPDNIAITKAYGMQALLFTLTTYGNRSIVYHIDATTAEKFDCTEGAITALENLAQYENDNTLLGKLFAYFPIAHWATVLSTNTRFHKISKIVDGFMGNIPGRMHNSPSELGYKCKNLPLAQYLSRYPNVHSRSTALEKYKTK